jgi:hypothetical protein
LDDIVLKAVAPNPDSRFQAVAHFASELRAELARIDARGGAGDEDDDTTSSSSLRRVATIAGLIIVLGAIGWLMLRP